ncbi:uncharacterized mitochondrial protein-like protein [Tanacetum coccineum]
MHDKFQMSSMGELTFFLGLQVQQKHDGIFISQDKYVTEILKKFDFATIKTASTPMEPNKALVKDEEAEDVDVHLFRSMIGSLMYLTASRPDITFAVCVCARFQVTPKTSHLNVVKRIFRYLKGQPKLGLWYPKDSSFDLEAYSDSDYAGASLDRKSTIGGCQFLGKRLNSWQCKKHTIVANSTTEAEYVATANCCGQTTKISQSSGSTNHVADETVHKELGDRMERAATTASSFEAEQDSGSGPRCQETTLGVTDAQTRFETVFIKSNDPPLSRSNILGSGEDNMKLKELTAPCTKLSENYEILKPAESNRFEQVIDFLNANPVKYALTVNPTVYSLCIKQFWATAKVKKVNVQDQIQALVDKKKAIITEESIRSDLYFADAEGTECLPNDTIFEELDRMGYEKPSQRLTFYKAFFSPQWKFLIHTILQGLSAKTTAWNEFSSTMASTIICLANNQKFNSSKYILANMVKNLEGGVKFFMFPRFLQVFLDKQVEGMNKHKETFVVSSHTKKIFANMRRQADGFSGDVTPLFNSMMVQVTEERKEVESPQVESEDEDNVPTSSNDPLPSGEDSSNLNELMVFCLSLQEQKKRLRPAGLRRLKRIGAARKSKSSKDKDSLGDQDDSSKQGRNIKDIDQDEAQEQLDEEMFRVDDLHGEEVTIEDIAAKTVTAAKEVTTVSGPTTTTINELTLAQTLIEIAAKSKKLKAVTTVATSVTTVAVTRPKAKGIVFHEHEQSHKPTVYSTQPSSKDKGKGIMTEPEKPLKRKDQVTADEEYAKQLAAEMEAKLAEEERVRRQKEEEAN